MCKDWAYKVEGSAGGFDSKVEGPGVGLFLASG